MARFVSVCLSLYPFIPLSLQKLRNLKVPGNEISGCSWEASSLRVCLAVDAHIFFANIRPKYLASLWDSNSHPRDRESSELPLSYANDTLQWAYCGETIVYSFNRVNIENVNNESTIVFWDCKLEEVYLKNLKHLTAICGFGDYCTIVNKADDPSGQVE